MGNVLRALVDTSTREVVIGDLAYRIRRITSADLGDAGAAALALVPRAAIDRVIAEDKSPDDAAAQTDALLKKIQEITPAQLSAMNKMQTAIVCAGVVAIGGPVEGTTDAGAIIVGEWEEVTLLADPKRADPDKGRISIANLPGGSRTISALAEQITALTGDDGEAARLLASFRAGARSARTA